MSDLLPANATVLERALAASVARVSAVPVPVASIWSPEACPVEFLPWLAWALSVDVWDATWPESVKRQVIRDSFAVHRQKGTAGAVRRALAATGAPSEIVEWWQTGGAPHTFTVRVDVAALMLRGRKFSAALVRQIERSVDAVKPVRSHYDIIAFYGVSARFHMGAFMSIVQRVEIPPLLPRAISVSGDAVLAVVMATNARIDILEGPLGPIVE